MSQSIIVISEQGLPVAQQLQKEFKEIALYSTKNLEGCHRIENLNHFLSQTFHHTDIFFFIGAMGICVRSIAPFIEDKHTDPGVICIDSTGKHVISVLSGHIGKANEWTKKAAQALGAEPVVTTQSDCTNLWALDLLAEAHQWTAHLPKSEYTLNQIIALFVNKKPTALLLDIRDEGTERLEQTCPEHVTIFYRSEDLDYNKYELLLAVSPYRLETPQLPTLQFIPKVLHIGMGLAHQAGPVEEVIAHAFTDLKTHGLYPEAIKTISTIVAKKDEPVIKVLQQSHELKLYEAEALSQIEVPTPSEIVQKHMGTPSVSEAASLLSSGSHELILKKTKGENYTIAASLDKAAIRQGHIEIVGAGPGDPDLISVRGRQFLEKADLILYAGSLVPRELTLCAKKGATVRSSASMNLEEQFELMKRFYDRGGFVVRLHTGDPCIYGAIEEQMNFFDHYQMSYHITPGISSFQAAAAALRSQFTIPERVQTIILTRGEGRTPMPEKEKLHLLARSQSTMCIFLSASIVDQVQDDLLKAYPPETPVAACYHLTWKDQRIYRGVLKNLAQIVKENQLTLTTMIVVGEAIDNREGVSKLYDKDFKHLFRS